MVECGERRQTSRERRFHLAEMAVAVGLFSFPALGYGWLGRQIFQGRRLSL